LKPELDAKPPETLIQTMSGIQLCTADDSKQLQHNAWASPSTEMKTFNGSLTDTEQTWIWGASKWFDFEWLIVKNARSEMVGKQQFLLMEVAGQVTDLKRRIEAPDASYVTKPELDAKQTETLVQTISGIQLCTADNNK
jgi:hypothetical protein